MDISLTQLEYIVAVDTYRHFGLAAEKCFVTQPTLSMQVKKLEISLGIDIFDRSRQPVIPTEAGQQLIEQARIVLQEAKKISELAQHRHTPLSGKLKIGIIPTLAPYLLPMFVGKMMQGNPSIHLQIQEMMTHDMIHALKTDQLDVGLLATPLQESNITEIPLFYEQIMLYADAGNSILQKADITASDLPADQMWMLSEGNCFRSHVVNLCNRARHNEEMHLQYESGSLETLRKLVDSEGGITLLPELAVQDLPAKKLQQLRSFTGPQPLREISLVYYRSAAKRHIIDVLQNHIVENIPAEMLNKSRGKVVDWR